MKSIMTHDERLKMVRELYEKNMISSKTFVYEMMMELYPMPQEIKDRLFIDEPFNYWESFTDKKLKDMFDFVKM